MDSGWRGSLAICGGRRLHGTVRIGGSKHAALNLLGALPLRDGTYVFHRMPLIADVYQMLAILRSMGVAVSVSAQATAITVDSAAFRYDSRELSRTPQVRSAILLLGSLLLRNGFVKMEAPLGDPIGERPPDEFLSVLDAFGVSHIEEGSWITVIRRGPLAGDRIVDLDCLGNASTTGVAGGGVPRLPGNNRTALAFILAASNRGTTRILNPLRTAENDELLVFLGRLGARIRNVPANECATSAVDIQGDKLLSGGSSGNVIAHSVSPDKCELVFWACAATLTDGVIHCDLGDDAGDHSAMMLPLYKCYQNVLRRLGAAMDETTIEPDGPAPVVDGAPAAGERARSTASGVLVFRRSASWPPSAIDLVSSYQHGDEQRGTIVDAFPQLIPLLMAASGTSSYRDDKYGFERLRTYLDILELKQGPSEFGGSDGNLVRVAGDACFVPGPLMARNIRDGAAKLLYLLKADGSSVLSGFQHVLRGYDRIISKLQACGATVRYP